MSKPLPKEGTKEYYEMLADEPSDFIVDGPEESKTAAGKVVKKTADEKEKRFQAALAEKAAAEAAQKEIDDIVSKLAPDQKERMVAAMGVVAAAATAASPLSRHPNYDHETKQKNLVKNTEHVRAQMEKLKDDYECVHYMGSLCDYWKSLMPLDHVQTNEHVAFLRHFRKERHLYGLPKFVPATPSPKGSKTSSRAASVAIDEEEQDQTEETK